ncbi:sulfate anion transporter [Lyophyllum atratum]|nr:sulfate anion transporter [Lyophyllum atratum]
MSGYLRAQDLGRSLNTSASSSVMDIDATHEERTALLDSSVDELGDVRYGSVSSSVTGPDDNRQKKQTSALARKIKYYIPAFSWIPNYSPSLLGGDVLAGITVASMLIPQSVSYATSLAKLSPRTGLFSASIPGIVYAFLGTSRQLNVAPEAALSLLLGQAVTDIRHDVPGGDDSASDGIGIGVATIITFQVGLISFLLGFFRLGFIDVVLSRALLRGFITAVAVVIMIEQLIPMFGLVPLQRSLHPDTTFDKVLFLIEHAFTKANVRTTIISFTALAALIALRFIKNLCKRFWWIYRIPEVLIVVIVSTILCREFRWDKEGVDILGSVPITTGGSFVQFPVRSSNLQYLRRTTSTAVMISIVGFLDSIVAAKQNGARFGYIISPNRELVALGAANLVGSFVPGTLPAYGSITRSRINGDVGGRTQMASLVCSGVILLATFFLLPWLYFLPKCVLASIICLIVFSLLVETPHDVMYYWRMGAWVDLALMSLTFVFSIVWDVEVGVIVSLIISLLLVVRRSSRARMAILGRIPGTDRWKPINENPEAEESVEGALIIRIRENLDFANTAQLKERLRRLELYGIHKSHPSEDPRRQQASVLVFHMADVESIDASAAQIMYELLEEYKSRGVGLFITHLAPGPRETFVKAGIVDLLGADAFRENVADAIALIERSR